MAAILTKLRLNETDKTWAVLALIDTSPGAVEWVKAEEGLDLETASRLATAMEERF